MIDDRPLCPNCGERLTTIEYKGEILLTHLYIFPKEKPPETVCLYKEVLKRE